MYVEKETSMHKVEMLHFISTNYFNVRDDGSVGLCAVWPPPDPLDVGPSAAQLRVGYTNDQQPAAARLVSLDFTYHVKNRVQVSEVTFVNACVGTAVSTTAPHFFLAAQMVPIGEGNKAIKRLIAQLPPWCKGKVGKLVLR